MIPHPSELSKHIPLFTATFPPDKISGSLTQFVFWFVTGKLAKAPLVKNFYKFPFTTLLNMIRRFICEIFMSNVKT